MLTTQHWITSKCFVVLWSAQRANLKEVTMRGNRSLKKWIVLCISCMAMIMLGWKGNSKVFDDQDYIDVAINDLLIGDDLALSGLSQADMNELVDRLQTRNIYPDGAERTTTASLPYCGGYWGYYAKMDYGEVMEENDSTSGFKYQVGPNCYMWAPDSDGNGESDCGGAPDDYMLSFYFGYHSESSAYLASLLRWTSSDYMTRLLLSNISFRLYEQKSGGGPDNYNVYTCIDDYFTYALPTFLVRKY
jgi:hypothetical protein